MMICWPKTGKIQINFYSISISIQSAKNDVYVFICIYLLTESLLEGIILKFLQSVRLMVVIEFNWKSKDGCNEL